MKSGSSRAKDALPKDILDAYTLAIYNPDKELRGSHLIDTNSGNSERGICSLPFVRQSMARPFISHRT
jgi:ribosomal protein S12 methylthiotransferase accessory factor